MSDRFTGHFCLAAGLSGLLAIALPAALAVLQGFQP